MFCSKCGKEISSNVSFCSNCGAPIGKINTVNVNTEEREEKIILHVKGSLVGGGQGKVTLTNKHIMWTKSASNFLAGGVLALLTKGSTSVAISDILSVEAASILGAACIQILVNNGKKYKFGFYKKEDRDQALLYLKNAK